MVFGLMKLNPRHCEDKSNEKKYAQIEGNQKDTCVTSAALEGQSGLGQDESTFSFTFSALLTISGTACVVTVYFILLISPKGQWILSSHPILHTGSVVLTSMPSLQKRQFWALISGC